MRLFRRRRKKLQAVIEGPDTFRLPVVGESHCQNHLSTICRGKPANGKKIYAALILEDDNPYDSLAVRVDIAGEPVGHLKREHAREYRLRLAEAGQHHVNARCRAIIHGGGAKYYGVWLDLPLKE